jgi:hypothetical protein
MELFFVSQYLVVLSRQGKNKQAWIKFNYRFKKERWYAHTSCCIHMSSTLFTFSRS